MKNNEEMEICKKVADKITAALAEGYYPIEDVLNGPKKRAIPEKVRAYYRCGYEVIHLNSDVMGKPSFDIDLRR